MFLFVCFWLLWILIQFFKIHTGSLPPPWQSKLEENTSFFFFFFAYISIDSLMLRIVLRCLWHPEPKHTWWTPVDRRIRMDWIRKLQASCQLFGDGWDWLLLTWLFFNLFDFVLLCSEHKWVTLMSLHLPGWRIILLPCYHLLLRANIFNLKVMHRHQDSSMT